MVLSGQRQEQSIVVKGAIFTGPPKVAVARDAARNIEIAGEYENLIEMRRR